MAWPNVRVINNREHQEWIKRECHRTEDFTFTSVSKPIKVSYTGKIEAVGEASRKIVRYKPNFVISRFVIAKVLPDPFDSSVWHMLKLKTATNSVQVQKELLQQLLVNNASTLPAILQRMRTMNNANT